MTAPDAISEILYNDYLLTLHTDWIVKIKCKYNFDSSYHTFIEYAYIDEDNNVCWLNDWYEGQDDYEKIEYCALDELVYFPHKIKIEKRVIK